MSRKEIIVEELKEVQKYFEEVSGACCPVCIIEAIEYIEEKGEANGETKD